MSPSLSRPEVGDVISSREDVNARLASDGILQDALTMSDASETAREQRRPVCGPKASTASSWRVLALFVHTRVECNDQLTRRPSVLPSRCAGPEAERLSTYPMVILLAV